MSALEGVGVSMVLVAFASAMLVGTGLKRQPGLGVLGTVMVIGVVLSVRGDGWAALGFAAPASWWATVALAGALGLALQAISIVLVEPLAERLTGQPHDHSVVADVRGSWKAFGLWLLLVWLVVAPLEEIVFRGFLMTEIARVVGTSPWATLLNVLLASIVFGLAHGYQGRSGMVSTGVLGAVLGWVFVASGFDLWLAILAHGFIDTVGIALIALGADEAIRRRLWAPPP